MNKRLNLSLVSPEKTIFEGEVSRITLPGTASSFTIWPRHAPLLSTLKAGKLTYVSDEQEHSLEIQNGFVEVLEDEVAVCVTFKQ